MSHELSIEGGKPFIKAAPIGGPVLDQKAHARRAGVVLIRRNHKRIFQLAPPCAATMPRSSNNARR
ncbi:hypothetical protein GOL25_28670 [Sinorhizobium medicae]|nr:hypothetical protein [Sinorhizobium medicae]